MEQEHRIALRSRGLQEGGGQEGWSNRTYLPELVDTGVVEPLVERADVVRPDDRELEVALEVGHQAAVDLAPGLGFRRTQRVRENGGLAVELDLGQLDLRERRRDGALAREVELLPERAARDVVVRPGRVEPRAEDQERVVDRKSVV